MKVITLSARRGVAVAIASHKAAVLADEAMFDDEFNCLDEAGAERTAEAEQAAWEAFIDVPCQTAADVQAKITYALELPVGARESNLHLIGAVDGETWDGNSAPARTVRFFRSLQIAL